MTTAVVSHIDIDDEGIAWIDDTNTRVIEVVLDRVAFGLTPEAIHEQHPHLSLAQIYAALAFYHDNRDQIDAQIEREHQEYQALAAEARKNDAAFYQRLREGAVRP